MRDGRSLPRGAHGPRHPAWWGMIWLVVIEAMVMASLATSWFYLRFHQERWPPPGVELPELLEPGLRTLMLVGAAVALWVASRAASRALVHRLLFGAALPVLAYLALAVRSLADRDYRWDSHVYGSLMWTVDGYTILHVLFLLGLQGAIAGFALWGVVRPERPLALQALAIYAIFVAASAVLTWLVLHLSPWILAP